MKDPKGVYLYLGLVLVGVMVGYLIGTGGITITGKVVGDCGDTICDPAIGEDSVTCPADCFIPPPGGYCGDGVCVPEDLEDEYSCPGDCGPVPGWCGDSICDSALAEDSYTCEVDCGPPPGFCGDTICDSAIGEDPTTCIQDCPDSCGDTICGSTEDSYICEADCGAPPGYCGDSICDPVLGEDSVACPGDCTNPDDDSYINDDGELCNVACQMGCGCDGPSYDCFEYCLFNDGGQVYGYGCEPSVVGYLVPDYIAWPQTPWEYMNDHAALRDQCEIEASAAISAYWAVGGPGDQCNDACDLSCCEAYAGGDDDSGGTLPV
tara:strand:+ start:1822 stop:2784 length:963 start_codon:yes stop_codon:yes gene_type:complete